MSSRLALISLVSATLCGLALAADAPSRAGGERDIDILVVNANGKARRNLTAGLNAAERKLEALSPDGRTLAYDRLRVEGTDRWWSVVLMPARGGAGRTLVSLPEANAYAPAWSRNGSLVAFETCCTPHAIGTVKPDGTGLSLMQGASEPAWLPGTRLAFLSGGGNGGIKSEIATAKPDGSERNSIFYAMPFEEFGSLAPSPDGRKIAFMAYSEGGEGLFFVDVVPGAQKSLITQTAKEFSWSPTSRRLVFVTLGGIVTVRPDGTGRRRFRATRFLSPAVPAWSPDGTRIAFVAGSSSSLVVLNVRHGSLRVVARGVESQRPIWSRDGRRLYYAAPT